MPMKHTYHIPFTPKLGQISIDVHDDVLTLLEERKPGAKSLRDDPELEQLYFAWTLIQAGTFRFSEEGGKDLNYILFEMEL